MDHPTYVPNLLLKVFNDSNGLSRFSLSGDLLVDLPVILLDLFIRSSEDGVKYENLVIKGSYDVCAITRGFDEHLIIQ